MECHTFNPNQPNVIDGFQIRTYPDMPPSSYRSLPNHNNTMSLPQGWEKSFDPETGRPFFVNHTAKQTQWLDPRDACTKPKNFADCIGEELPFGWESAYHPLLGLYFINHFERVNQLDDPRVQWLAAQANMVIDYLQEANVTDNSGQVDVTSPVTTMIQQRATPAHQPFSKNSSLKTINSNPLIGGEVYFENELTLQQTRSKPNESIAENELINETLFNSFKSTNQQQASKQPLFTSTMEQFKCYENYAATSLSSLNASNSNSKVALQFDDNSDYAVIDSSGSNSNLANLHHYEFDGAEVEANYCPMPSMFKIKPQSVESNSSLGCNSVRESKCAMSVGLQKNVESSLNLMPTDFNRTLLQQSLSEAKQRVAQLKQELGANYNYNLLSIIDKYYTKNNTGTTSDRSNAIEV